MQTAALVSHINAEVTRLQRVVVFFDLGSNNGLGDGRT